MSANLLPFAFSLHSCSSFLFFIENCISIFENYNIRLLIILSLSGEWLIEGRRWQPSRWKLSPLALAPNSYSQLIFLQITSIISGMLADIKFWAKEYRSASQCCSREETSQESQLCSSFPSQGKATQSQARTLRPRLGVTREDIQSQGHPGYTHTHSKQHVPSYNAKC